MALPERVYFFPTAPAASGASAFDPATRAQLLARAYTLDTSAVPRDGSSLDSYDNYSVVYSYQPFTQPVSGGLARTDHVVKNPVAINVAGILTYTPVDVSPTEYGPAPAKGLLAEIVKQADARTLWLVATPTGVHEAMLITNLSEGQARDGGRKIDVQIGFIQLRLAAALTAPPIVDDSAFLLGGTGIDNGGTQ